MPITVESLIRSLPLLVVAALVAGALSALVPLRPKQSRDGSPPTTLVAFVENNYRLLTALGVFTALTVYSGNLTLKPVGYVLSFFFLAAAVLLWLELWANFPRLGTARLFWFENILFFATMILVFYWLVEFRSIWRSFLFLPIAFFILSLLAIIVKRYDLFSRATHAEPGRWKLLRYIFALSLFWFSVLIALYIAALVAQPVNDFLDLLDNELRGISQ